MILAFLATLTSFICSMAASTMVSKRELFSMAHETLSLSHSPVKAAASFAENSVCLMPCGFSLM